MSISLSKLSVGMDVEVEVSLKTSIVAFRSRKPITEKVRYPARITEIDEENKTIRLASAYNAPKRMTANGYNAFPKLFYRSE